MQILFTHSLNTIYIIDSYIINEPRHYRYHPHSTPSTNPTGSLPRSSAWRHRRKKINGLVQQGSLSALQPLRAFSKGEKVFLKPRPGNKHQPWIYGEVIGTRGKTWGPHCIVAWKWAYRNGSTSRAGTCTPKWPRTYFYVMLFNETAKASLKVQGLLFRTKENYLIGEPIIIHEDNQEAFAMANNPVDHARIT